MTIAFALFLLMVGLSVSRGRLATNLLPRRLLGSLLNSDDFETIEVIHEHQKLLPPPLPSL